MRKHSRFWLVVVLRTGLALALLVPSFRFRIRGLLYNESFHKGRPTSYWREVVRDWNMYSKCITIKSKCITIKRSCGIRDRLLPPPPPTLRDRLEMLVASIHPSHQFVLPPEGEDPEALPVLIELLADDDPEVRAYAAFQLSKAGQLAEAALPRLTDLLRDEDPEVRRSALVALVDIEQRSEVTVPRLVEMLKDRVALVRRRAADALGMMGERARGAVPALRDALTDPDEQVRVEAAEALKRIGPYTASRDACRTEDENR